jgi:hypothetical protein
MQLCALDKRGLVQRKKDSCMRACRVAYT